MWNSTGDNEILEIAYLPDKSYKLPLLEIVHTVARMLFTCCIYWLLVLAALRNCYCAVVVRRAGYVGYAICKVM